MTAISLHGTWRQWRDAGDQKGDASVWGREGSGEELRRAVEEMLSGLGRRMKKMEKM